jgi:hypothetical protein
MSLFVSAPPWCTGLSRQAVPNFEFYIFHFALSPPRKFAETTEIRACQRGKKWKSVEKRAKARKISRRFPPCAWSRAPPASGIAKKTQRVTRRSQALQPVSPGVKITHLDAVGPHFGSPTTDHEPLTTDKSPVFIIQSKPIGPGVGIGPNLLHPAWTAEQQPENIIYSNPVKLFFAPGIPGTQLDAAPFVVPSRLRDGPDRLATSEPSRPSK